MRAAGEVDVHNRAGCGRVCRRELRQCIIAPGNSLLRKIEIKIDAVRNALATQRFKPRINGFADRAELCVGRIAQRANGKARIIETRRGIAH